MAYIVFVETMKPSGNHQRLSKKLNHFLDSAEIIKDLSKTLQDCWTTTPISEQLLAQAESREEIDCLIHETIELRISYCI